MLLAEMVVLVAVEEEAELAAAVETKGLLPGGDEDMRYLFSFRSSSVSLDSAIKSSCSSLSSCIIRRDGNCKK